MRVGAGLPGGGVGLAYDLVHIPQVTDAIERFEHRQRYRRRSPGNERDYDRPRPLTADLLRTR